MKKKVSLFLTALSCAVGAVAASEINSVQVAEVHGNVTAHKHRTDNNEYTRFRMGGYGEAVASFKDYGINRYYGNPNGNTRVHRNTISIPRFVLAMDYKFSSKWILSAEIEFEAGGNGSAMELENSENGEYETEMEKGGEVALEQFHITRLIHPAFNVRAGHMIVPVGLTNAHHEPINFFGTVRPEGETTILPSTWHETGIEFFGTLGKGYATFDYQVLVVAGLNANGFDRNTWVASGKQGLFEEDNFNSPGYVFRVDYRGVPGLRVGGSFYYCANTAGNSDKPNFYEGQKAPLRIYSGDLQYKNDYVTARANVVYGNLSNSKFISSKNVRLSNNASYSRVVPVAKNAVSYAGEVGVNLRSIFNHNPKVPVIYPFARYEYYNKVAIRELSLIPNRTRAKIRSSVLRISPFCGMISSPSRSRALNSLMKFG
jgi:hypothetical protein